MCNVKYYQLNIILLYHNKHMGHIIDSYDGYSLCLLRIVFDTYRNGLERHLKSTLYEFKILKTTHLCFMQF